ncbi:hypothetical protein CTEN210_00879 [Chaetoceros tenuissimus]|uniref:Actin-related protein 2/3 complex subunit 4 n=1 Tax=Chaetoceros tenuissimus TaxID=426638 RepID=A0AAD3GZ57_9STRA|nr:hypothetical protein CTEN210_00879 [Chaetoceros tenuissimus]
MNTNSYEEKIQAALDEALNLKRYKEKPQVEIVSSPSYIKEPILVSKSENEKCLIERSINSVRISYLFPFETKQESIDKLVGNMLTKFLMRRADAIPIFRRVAIEGYSISFLITFDHLEKHGKEKILKFLGDFRKDIEKDINSFKLDLNSQARAIAADCMKLFE